MNKILEEKAQKYQRLLGTMMSNFIANKLETIEEVHKFPSNHILPKLCHETTENLNRSIMNNEIKSVIVLKCPK